MSETWAEYLQRVTRGVPRKDVAAAAGIDPSGVSRWMRSQVSSPHAENVVRFARGLQQSPAEALIAAGYLTPDDVNGVVRVAPSRSDMSTDDLMEEIKELWTELERRRKAMRRPAKQKVAQQSCRSIEDVVASLDGGVSYTEEPPA